MLVFRQNDWDISKNPERSGLDWLTREVGERLAAEIMHGTDCIGPVSDGFCKLQIYTASLTLILLLIDVSHTSGDARSICVGVG